MFKAISHQLELQGEKSSVAALRQCTADRLRGDRDHFAPFLIDATGDFDGCDGFLAYCDQMEKTPAWGGHVEVNFERCSVECPALVTSSQLGRIHPWAI
jgi:OTU domain-containing protein 6